MTRYFGAAVIIILLAAAASASTVKYAGLSAYLATPQSAGRHPALVAVHEWWGLNDWIRGQADAYAKHGYVTLAVDLYRGKSTASAEEAHELSRGLPDDRAMRDLQAAVAYLAKRPDVNPKAIGVIGWCMGGGYALKLAVDDPRIEAAVVAYGRPITDPAALKTLKAPILGIFGTEDKGIPPASVAEFEKAMKAAGKRLTVHSYSAGHAFMNPNNKSGYDKADAASAQAQIDAFLKQTLR